jgi:hypothetical protein
MTKPKTSNVRRLISFPVPLYLRIQKDAAKAGFTVSAFIRVAVAGYLEICKQKPPGDGLDRGAGTTDPVCVEPQGPNVS